MIGVHFAPGGAGPFLGAAPGQLADAHLDLETLWPRQASELRERLCEAPSPVRRFRILENALVARLGGTLSSITARSELPWSTSRGQAWPSLTSPTTLA